MYTIPAHPSSFFNTTKVLMFVASPTTASGTIARMKVRNFKHSLSGGTVEGTSNTFTVFYSGIVKDVLSRAELIYASSGSKGGAVGFELWRDPTDDFPDSVYVLGFGIGYSNDGNFGWDG